MLQGGQSEQVRGETERVKGSQEQGEEVGKVQVGQEAARAQRERVGVKTRAGGKEVGEERTEH